jgi:phosphoribosyl 1,2-cyclic phosphodiesterase
MRIEILGARANIARSAPGYARHAGVLIDRGILLDLGEPAYLRRRPRQIFITHLHPDHAAFLTRSLAWTGALYVPERTRKAPAAKLILRPLSIGAHRVIPVPTAHAVNARSVGYVVERGRRRVFYSSDMISIHRRYYRRLGTLDLVITDGSFMRRGGLVRRDPATGRRYGHAGIPDLIEFFSRFTRRIVVTHLGSWFYADIPASIRRLAALGNDNAVAVIAGRDGMVIEL